MTSTISSKIPDHPASRLFAAEPGNGTANLDSTRDFASALDSSRMRQHERATGAREPGTGSPPSHPARRPDQADAAPRSPQNDPTNAGASPAQAKGASAANEAHADPAGRPDSARSPDTRSEDARGTQPAQAQAAAGASADAITAVLVQTDPAAEIDADAGEPPVIPVVAMDVAASDEIPLPTGAAPGETADSGGKLQQIPLPAPKESIQATALPIIEPPAGLLLEADAEDPAPETITPPNDVQPLPPDPASLAAVTPLFAAAAANLSPQTGLLVPPGSDEPVLPGTAPRTSLDALIGRLFGASSAPASGEASSGTRLDQAIREVLEGGTRLQNSGRLFALGAEAAPQNSGPSTIARAGVSASGSLAGFTNVFELATQNASAAAVARPLAASPLDPQSPAFLNSMIPALRSGEQPPIQLPVATPAGQKAWAEDVGGRLLWMVGRGESRAELVLTPPNLGKVGISLHLNGDQTSAHFVAATPAAREALEQALPRLREVLQQAGIQLGQANVSTSGEQGTREQADANRSPFAGRGQTGTAGEGDRMPLPPPSLWTRSGSGVIDIFA